MTHPRRLWLLLATGAAAVLVGCGPAAAHEAGGAVAPQVGAPDGPSLALVVIAGSVLALTGALAISVARWRPRPAQVAGVALLFTGVAHCALTPSHWSEGWYLGAFFAVSGLALMGQGLLMWGKPSDMMHASVIATTAALIALYFLTRQGALPFIDHRDPYLFEELPIKAAELLAGAVSVVALAAGRRPRLHMVPSGGFQPNSGAVSAGVGVT